MPISSPCCAASASPASNSISRGQAIIVIRRLQQFFAEQIQQRAATDAAGSERALHLATAALLIEVTRADYQVELSEQKAVVAAVQDLFGLTVQETDELIALAEQEARQSVSLFQFTELVDRQFTAEQKVRVVEMMWRVAYADRHKDKYEEHVVRKVAELLHVPHSAFIRARHVVEQEWQS